MGSVLCNSGNNVCVNGICSGSVCIRMNYTDCQCSRDDNPDSNLCHICCTQKDGSGGCLSSFDLFGQMGQFREGGRSCDEFRGYCSNDQPPKYGVGKGVWLNGEGVVL